MVDPGSTDLNRGQSNIWLEEACRYPGDQQLPINSCWINTIHLINIHFLDTNKVYAQIHFYTQTTASIDSFKQDKELLALND